MFDSVLVWFRRDLRDDDHVALAEALRRGRRVFCAFVFDRQILDALPTRDDRRVAFIYASLLELDAALRRRGGGLIVRHAHAVDEIPALACALGVSAVFVNRDYEPQAKERDARVARALIGQGIAFEAFKDQVVFDAREVLTRAGQPFTVYTPYRRAWLQRLSDDDVFAYGCAEGSLAPPPADASFPAPGVLGLRSPCPPDVVPGMRGARQRFAAFRARMARYADERDYPARAATSGLSVHLRFGTLSIRELVRTALAAGALRGAAGAASWLGELIWRDFYFMILDHFPHVAQRAFKPAFEAIVWEQGETARAHFAAWCAGETGYPLVDAAMRQLNQTGFMHNRLRMLTASFLCKDLGIDWRRGEAYFAARLLDFDLAANNGGWQWSASCGCDAQPYFRIFNPLLQSARFDSHGEFICRYLPELAALPLRFVHAPWRMPAGDLAACGVFPGKNVPFPLVEHAAARQRCLQRYAAIRSKASAA